MRAVITGINGQDGKLISAKLTERNISVFGVSKPSSDGKAVTQSQSQAFNLDLSRRSVCFDFLNSIRPDLIFHFAAVHASSDQMRSKEEQSGAQMHACHVEITRNILDWQIENPDSKSVIALSSQMFERNSSLSVLIDEESIPNSNNEYGRTKAEAWKLLKSYRTKHGIRTAGVILFNHASILSKSEFLFPQLAIKIGDAIEKQDGVISVRNSHALIDITSADEICDAIIAISLLENLQDFVLGSGKSQTIFSILKEYAQSNGIDFSIIDTVSSETDNCLVSSISKAENVLGWSPRISPAELLAGLVKDRARKITDGTR